MIWLWTAFIAFVVVMLALDLGVFHRTVHVVGVREALAWSSVWIALALAFAVFVYFAYEGRWFGLGTAVDTVDGLVNDGTRATEKYLTGYVVEKSLSVDNIFVIAMIFGFFTVPPLFQHRLLFSGILGALVLRGAMIGLGAKLIAEFHWVLYVFAAFLVLTGVKMLLLETGETDPSKNLVVRLTRRLFPVTAQFHGGRYVVRAGATATPDPAAEKLRPGTLMLTPMALALVMIETTDVVFAVDSIPAIFAITGDAFLVFTSNVFAILGLRSLYFALAGMVAKFRYLKTALAVVLLVVGVKMLLAEPLKLALGEHFNLVLLGAVLAVLSVGVAASLIAERRTRGRA